jgi:hypothetical protein
MQVTADLVFASPQGAVELAGRRIEVPPLQVQTPPLRSSTLLRLTSGM